MPLALQSANDTVIVATVPIAALPPGEYVLTVSRGSAPDASGSFDITLGVAEPDAAAAPGVPDGAGVPALTAAEQGELAAQVGDRVITVAEVDQEWRRRDPASYIGLLREIHEIRWTITDIMVADELFALEATARGLTTRRCSTKRSHAASSRCRNRPAQSLYQSLGDSTRGATFEQMRPAIRAWLEQVTEPELAKLNYREELTKISTRTEMLLVPPQVTVDRTAQDATLGPETAPVEVVAFGDFQNGAYAGFAQLFSRVRDTYGDRVRFVFKHLPANQTASLQAAQARSVPTRRTVLGLSRRPAGARGGTGGDALATGRDRDRSGPGPVRCLSRRH